MNSEQVLFAFSTKTREKYVYKHIYRGCMKEPLPPPTNTKAMGKIKKKVTFLLKSLFIHKDMN